MSGCDQLVVGPTHARRGILDLLMTDVPDLVRVSAVAPVGNSNHSSLSAVISMAWAVPNLCVSWKVFLNHQVNWNTVCGAMQDLPCRNIWSADNPVEVLNEHLLLLVGCFVPTKIICVCNMDKPWFDDQCRHAFSLKQEAHLWLTRNCSRVNWDEFVHCQVRANETYSEDKRQFSARNWDVLMNAQSHHKWWSTLKSAVFGLISSLPPVVGGGGGLVCESVGKADLLSDNYDGKQSRESVNLKRTGDVLAPRHSVVFRWLVRLGSFSACWRKANVTPIPKGPLSPSVANYRPISITSVLHKVFF